MVAGRRGSCPSCSTPSARGRGRAARSPRPRSSARSRRRPRRTARTGAGTGRTLKRAWSSSSGPARSPRPGANDAVRAPLRPARAGAAAGRRRRARPRPGRRRAASSSGSPPARCGVATERGLRDYFRLRAGEARPAVAELVEAGRAAAGRRSRAGPRRPTCTRRRRRPRRVTARALLSPFDSLVWERDAHRGAVRLPLPHRDLHARATAAGPRLLRAAVPARRPAGRPGRPQVRPRGERHGPAPREVRLGGGLHPPGTPHHTEVAGELAAELALTAAWLGLDGVTVEPRGDLAPALAAQVACVG